MKTAITALVVGRAGKPKGAGRVQPLFDAALSHRKSKSSLGDPLPARAYAVVPPATLVPVPTVPIIVIVVVILVVMMVVMMMVMLVMIIVNELHVWVGMATRRVGDPQKRGGIGNGIKQFAK